MRTNPRKYHCPDGPRRISDFDVFAGQVLYIPVHQASADNWSWPFKRGVCSLRYCRRIYEAQEKLWSLAFRIPNDWGDDEPIWILADNDGLLELPHVLVDAPVKWVPCFNNFFLAYGWALRHLKNNGG